jgi:hypothetical protein
LVSGIAKEKEMHEFSYKLDEQFDINLEKYNNQGNTYCK